MNPEIWSVFKTIRQLAKEEREREGPQLPEISVINSMTLASNELQQRITTAWLCHDKTKLMTLISAAIYSQMTDEEQIQLGKWRTHNHIEVLD